ncbi:MAG: folylpolyglutamate synthase/dihydrofolate synthase family protein [Desulfosalsimonadaceae bacterium]|nr:folylpolyglutamate synthase/dihydrofolate synthase family protein [Desulfosalsimonadaceae bacterium]
MYSLHRFGIKLGLDVISRILENLGNPNRSFSCIHIAGTNGKGSIASGLAHILHASGFSVGLYTSPHLLKFNERIIVNHVQISDKDIVDTYQTVKSACDTDREPTFFEYTTAMALHHFAKSRVDWAVIETGMGGRLDATNILNPEISIISNISLEHRSYLGNTISDITREKAGIIKSNTPVVTGVTQKSAISVIETVASEMSAPLYRLGRDFRVRRKGKGWFSYFGMDNQWQNMRTGLRGNHQIDNAALVLAACEILRNKNVPITLETIRHSLDSYQWPGRLEILPTSPPILIDGAHNLMSARVLGNYFRDELSDEKITLVIGVLDDKPYQSILQSLLPHCRRVILTEPKIDRRLSPEKMMDLAKSLVPDTEIVLDVGAAVRHAISTTPSDGMVCIAGSLYVVGEAKQALAEMGIGGKATV